MKTKHTKIAMTLAVVLTSTSLILPGVSYADNWHTYQTNQTEARQDMGKVIAGGLALLGLLLLAGSGDQVDASGDSRMEYEYVPGQQPAPSYSSTPAPTTTGFYGNCHGGSFYGC